MSSNATVSNREPWTANTARISSSRSSTAIILDGDVGLLTAVTFSRHSTASGCCVRLGKATNGVSPRTGVLYKRSQTVMRPQNPLDRPRPSLQVRLNGDFECAH